MNVRAAAVLVAGSIAVGVVAAVVFDLSFERAALLAPVFVLSAAAVIGLVVLWARVVWESVRGGEARSPE